MSDDVKRRVYISDHGTFTLFDMRVSLPAILELTESQIDYIKKSGIYKISELSASQTLKIKPTSLTEVDGNKFETGRTRSVNELAFKKPIMGTKFAEKAKNAVIVKRSSSYGKTLKDINDQSISKKNVPTIPVKDAVSNNLTISRKTNNNTKPNKPSSTEADVTKPASTISGTIDNTKQEAGEKK